MTSMFGGRGTEDGPIAPASAPDDADGVRRVMTLLGLPGAWLRRLRSPAFRAVSSRIGGNRSAARRGRDRSGRPGSLASASAAGRGIAGALDGICRLSRAAVLTLLCLALLAGVATQASAQTLPTVSFGSRAPAPWHIDENIFSRGTAVPINLKLDKASPSDFTVNYTIGGTATPSSYSLFLSSRRVTPGSDFVIRKFTPGTVKVPAGKTGRWLSLGRIWMSFVDDSVHEDSETVLLTLVEGEGYQVGSPSTFTVVIVDDDPRPAKAISFASASQSAGEGSGTRNVEVTLNPAPATDIALDYTVTGTATAGSDYTALSGTVAVSKGAATATIPVTLIDDSAQEGSETVVLTLAAGSGYGLVSPDKHTLTIVDDDGPLTAFFASASQSADEGSGTRDVEVRLNKATASDITLAYTVTGTATSGSDYTALSGTVTVPARATTATIPVALIDNSVPESSETVVLKLTAGSGYAVSSSGTHTLTIVDDEPTISFASASQSAGEGSGTHDVGVTLNPAPPSDITLAYTVSGTATSRWDYTALSGTVTVPAHATTATIPVTIVDDVAYEASETVVLKLAAGATYHVGSPGTHTLTIANDDPIVFFASASQSADEWSGTRDVEVTLDPAPATDITLDYTVRGTATAGSDFTIANSSTVTVPKGATTATIPVALIDDSVHESSETVVLKLIPDVGYAVGSPATHTLTIADDDPAISFASASQSAGEGSGTLDVEVRLNLAPATDITLTYTVDGTATAGSDYTALSGTVAVPASATTATIPVTITDDSAREGSETVVLKLAAGSGYRVGSPGTHTLTIVDDDTPTVSFASASQSADEGAGTLDVGVTLNPAPTSDVTLSWTVDGTATAGSDYTALSGTVAVSASATTATIPVTLIDDSVWENRETVVLTLIDGGAVYQVGSPDTHTLTIDDNEPTVSFASASQSAGEGSGTHDVGVTLDKAPTTDVTLSWTVDGTATAGSDFTIANSGTVTVPAHAKTATIPVTIVDDSVHEGSETVVLTLIDGGAAYQVGSPATHTLTIDDDEPTVSFVSASQSAGEESGTRNVEVTLDKAPTTGITLTYTVDGTATAGSDYTALSGTLSVPASATTATIPVTLIDDSAPESSETVVLTLAAGSGYGVGSPATHTLTIAASERPTTTAAFASASQSADEGAGTLDAGVTLSPAPTTDITLSWTVGGTATSGSDFTIANSGTLSVPAHATTAAIPVTLIDDSVPESNETVVLTLIDGGAAYQVGSPATHTLTIAANDAQPPATSSVSFASGTYRVNEGGALRPELVLSHWRSEAVTVVVEALDLGEAESGADFAADPWRVTIPAGETRHTFSIETFDDAKREGDEQFLLHIAPSGHSPGIQRSTNGNPDAVAYIIDDTRVSLRETEYTVTEGATATIRVAIDNPKPAAFTLDYTLSGAGGASGADVTGGFGARSVTVAANAKGVSFPIETVQDTEPGEVGESIEVELSTTESDVVFAARRAVVHIADDDSPAVTFAASASRAGEGSGTHDVTVTLSRAPATDMTVPYTVEGTAAADADYTALAGTLTVPAHATTATVAVALVDDSVHEGAETVVLALVESTTHTVGTPGTHTLTIADDEGTPQASFASASQSANEGAGTREVTVNLSPASAFALTLAYTVGGTATPGADFTIADSGTVAVPAGATTATIAVAMADDGAAESAETVVLTLAAGTGYTPGGVDAHTLTIADDDGAPPAMTASFAAASSQASESSGTRNVAVNLSPAPTAAVTLAYTVGGTATPGADFTIVDSGTVAVPANAASVAIPVSILEDDVPDRGETVVLALTAGSGYRVGSPGTHTLHIGTLPRVSFAEWGLARVEGEGAASVALDLSPAPDRETVLAYTVGGTATPGADFTIADSGTVTVPAGAATATVEVTVIDDTHEDSGETVVLTLAEGTDYTVRRGARPSGDGRYDTFTLYIFNDDPDELAPLVRARLDAAVAGGDTASANLWRCALAALHGEAPPGGLAPMTEAKARALGDGALGGSDAGAGVLWLGIARAIAGGLTTTPPAVPEVAIAGGAGATEGEDATFTLTASPAPASALTVNVTVTETGGYASAGTHQVTIPTTGSAQLDIATTNDDADEANGTVTATVATGEGYTVSATAGLASVAIADDDPTPTTTGVDPALIAQVRGYAAETHEGQAHVDRWRRVLAAFGDDNGYTAMTAAEAQTYADQGWQRWVPVVDALEALEAVTPPGTVPAVSVSAGADVTEGGDAVFTVTASPAPAAELAVSVTVAADGEYGVTAGSRTVTVPTGGSATLTLATTSDDTDEPDGSVTATVAAGDGYTAGAPASGSVSIEDDDEPPPVEPAVTIAAGASPVTEGGDATFTLTASPAPASPLTVSVTVAADGAYGITAGKRTVTIPTAGSATLTLATTNDDTDEPDGSVTVTLNDGEGYTVGAPASDTISIEDDDLPPPVVTVTASTAPVTEGADAVFTVSASRAPDADLAVTLEVADAPDSDFVAGGDEGARTVTIPDGATSVVFTLATANDATDEPDGVVTVTVKAGDGYTVGAPASDTISIEDDDLPPPVVSIAAKAASVTEGGTATFTLTADRAPAADLTVTLAVSETGDHVAAETEGAATAVIAKGETQAAFSVATVNDDADEPDGVVTVTLEAGEGYTVSASQGAATVTVSDDDAAPGPMLSVADVTVTEGAWMEFTVRLSAPSAGGVSVKVSTRDSTPASATARDYWPLSGRTVSFRAGETERSVGVIVYDDSHDEGSETFEMVLSDARGAPIGDGVAVGTIVNDDPMPAAWLARLGRTVAEQALDGIAGRIAAPRTPGMQGTLAGRALDFGAPDHGHAGPDHPPAGAPALGGTGSVALSDAVRGFASHSGRLGTGDDAAGVGGGFGEAQSHAMTAREALLGSSFTLTGETDASGGSMAFWGRGSQSRFDGREGTFSLDGEVTTGMLGADYARDEWLVGLALAQSTGEGGYRDTGVSPRPDGQSCPDAMDAAARALCAGAVRAGDGTVEASLTAALPYASLQASERLELWGALGYGAGEVTLKTALGGRYRSDTTWRMAAAGLRGDLLTPPTEGSGPALALTSDALWARTSSEKTRHLAASDSDATRLRLGLEGSWRMALDGGAPGAESGASLTPKLEVGARHDGGDAETGFGIELGGGIAWVDPALGLTLDVSGRTLLAHEDGDLEDRGYAASLGFDPRPASERGPSLSLRQELGARATGGLDALFQSAPLDDRTDSEATGRWSLEAAYGVPAFGGRYTGSPHVGLGLSAAARDYSLGGRWTPAESAPDLAFAVKATRRESDTAAPEHTVGFEVRATW